MTLSLLGLHHIHMGVPDISASATFLKDFGLLPAAEQGNLQYFRTAGTKNYSVILEQTATPQLISFALEVESADDLAKAVAEHGASAPEGLSGPGGGSFVTLNDPDGNIVNLVHGIEEREADAPYSPFLEVNYGDVKTRKNESQHFKPLAPAQLLRLGHVGLFTIDMAATEKWYCEVLGLIPSDVFFGGHPDNHIAGFFRIDRGDEYVDHHTIALFGMGKKDLHHVSFEVEDSEVQFMSHRYMLQQKHDLVWGVGRHPKGSHVFDLWREPNGYRFETFSDTDLCTASREPSIVPIDEQEMDMWLDQSHEPYFA